MNLSQKTFCIFFSLTMASVFLAAGLFLSIFAEMRSHSITERLFQTTQFLHEVEHARFRLIDENSAQDKQSFEKSVSDAHDYLEDFLKDKTIRGKAIGGQLRTMLFQLGTYQRAALELQDKTIQNRKLKIQLRQTFFEIPELLRKQPTHPSGLAMIPRIAVYRKALESILWSSDFDAFPEARITGPRNHRSDGIARTEAYPQGNGPHFSGNLCQHAGHPRPLGIS